MMTNKLLVLTCENFKKELAVVIEAEDFDDVTTATFPATCGHPPLSWDDLDQVIRTGRDCSHCAVLGRGCLVGLGDPPEELAHCQLHRLDQCFHLFADRDLLDGYLKDGAYLITPGWLGNWRRQIERWGFDRELAREFFGESIRRLLLLDTGVDAKSSEHLREFADFVDRPFEIVPTGLGYFRLFLTKIVMEWQLVNQKSEASIALRSAQKQTAEYAMAMELLKSLARTMTETEAIQNIIDIFTALFAPQELFYLPWQDGKSDQVWRSHSSSPVVSAAVQDRLSGFDKEYDWTESGDGFRLRLSRQNKTLGILEVNQIAFPEYMERYLNLALALADVCGLAIHNARIYQQIKRTEEAQEKLIVELQEALAKVKTLSGLLPICASCKKIRDDEGYWQDVAIYIRSHSEVEFTHGICPDCMKELYPEFYEEVGEKQ